MRTIECYKYLCRDCGCDHGIDIITFEEKKDDYIVFLKCPILGNFDREYSGKEFKYFHGIYWDICNSIVKPSSITYIGKSKALKINNGV